MRAPEKIRDDEARRRPPRQGLIVGTVAAILAAALLGPMMTLSGIPLTGEGSPLRQSIYPVILVLVIIACRPLEAPRRLLAVPLPIVLALAWCWLSIVWAIDPSVAVRRLILTTVVIVSIFVSIRQAGYARTVTAMRIILTIALIGNFITVLGFPETGIHQGDELFDIDLVGDWRGFMLHKNIAAAATALTLLAFVFDADRIPRWLRIGVIAAATFFLWKSGSRTSAGVCIAAVAVGFIYLRYNARYRLFVMSAVCLVGLVGALMSAMYHNPFNGVLSDKTAFTGRTQIWWALAEYAGDNPLLGSGCGSFWNIGGKSPIYQYASNWVVTLYTGHNGFLDMLTQVGVPGLLLIVFATVAWPLYQLFRNPVAAGPRGALIFSMLLFCIIHNVTETSLFDRDVIVEVFLMTAIALLATILREPAPVIRRPTGTRKGAMSFRDLAEVRAPA